MKTDHEKPQAPEVSANSDDSINDNESDFMRDMRRSTRIALRIDVRISVHDSPTKTFDAWTVVVNMHGAMFECTRSFIAGQEIGLATVSRKFARAKVVWAQRKPNSQGNFAFAVELEKPEILFDIANPPTNWKV